MGLIQADARHLPLVDQSVHCCVTSPPYFGLRDYGVSGQIGLERTIEAYVAAMVAVFQEVKRVLRDDATLWLNLGDSYFGGKGHNGSSKARRTATERGYTQSGGTVLMDTRPLDLPQVGLKPKDLCMIPARMALALQADGWYLRSDIIWAKPNCMPESVQDRCTRSHEHIFMLSKQPKYYYDALAIAEPSTNQSGAAANFKRKTKDHLLPNQQAVQHRLERESTIATGVRNKRDVWTVSTANCKEVHFATFPPKLITPCVLAGTSAWGVCPVCGAPWTRVTGDGEARLVRWAPGPDKHTEAIGGQGKTSAMLTGIIRDKLTLGWRATCDCGAGEPVPAIVLDPFVGSGTTGIVAIRNGRRFIGVDLSYSYLHDIARKRLAVNQVTLQGL